MTRAERRRLEREVAKNVSDAVVKAKNEATTDAFNVAFVAMLAMPLIVLRDKFGFGKVRLERFVDELCDVQDSFNQGYVTLEDLHKTLYEETGTVITNK